MMSFAYLEVNVFNTAHDSSTLGLHIGNRSEIVGALNYQGIQRSFIF